MTSSRERVSANLKRIRKQRQEESDQGGFSQTDLADRAGLSRTYIAKVENGYTSPSLNAVDQIADALEIDPMDLFKPLED